MKYFHFLMFLLAANTPAADDTMDLINSLSLAESKIEGNYKNWEAGFRSFYIYKDESNRIEVKEPPLKHQSKYPPHMSCEGIHYHGTNKGEWGGELTGKDKNGKERVIVKGNIYHLVNWYETLYIFVGSQHMRSGGAVYSLDACNTFKEDAVLVTLLPDAPIDIEIEDRPDLAQFFIFGNNMILHLTPESGFMEVYIYNPWKGLHPTSTVRINESEFLVGLESGIATVNLRNKKGNRVKVFVPHERATR